MNRVELSKRFLEWAQNSAGKPEATAETRIATLYGTDEVEVDYINKTVKLPGQAAQPCLTLDSELKADWYATAPVPGVGEMFHIGVGDPFTPSPRNPLPMVQGCIMAVPYSVMVASHQTMNRQERRAAGLRNRR